MKQIFKKLNEQTTFRTDSNSEFLYFVLRGLTYLTALVIIPPVGYYNKFIHFNNSVVCNQYMDFSLSLTKNTVIYLHHSLIVLLIFAAIGFLSQISAILSFSVFTLLTVHTLSSCYANHAYFPLGLILLVWCVNIQSNKYSLDAWIQSRRNNKKKSNSEFKSSLFFYLKIHFSLVFTFAGLTKLRMAGVDWFLSDNLAHRMILQNFLQNKPAIDWPILKSLNHFVIETPHLTQVLGFFVILIELSMISLIFVKNRKIQMTMVLLMAFLQLNFYMIMFVNFYTWIALYLVWIVLFFEKPLLNLETYCVQKLIDLKKKADDPSAF